MTAGDFNKIEYDRLMAHSNGELSRLRNTIIKSENIVHELESLMEKFLDNVKFVTKRLHMALPENKREIVDIFCENLLWKDGKLEWTWKKPYYFLSNRRKSSTVLPRWDSTRIEKWVKIYLSYSPQNNFSSILNLQFP